MCVCTRGLRMDSINVIFSNQYSLVTIAESVFSLVSLLKMKINKYITNINSSKAIKRVKQVIMICFWRKIKDFFVQERNFSSVDISKQTNKTQSS